MKRTPDLEASTFQKRPAYRYIRATDKVPAIGQTQGESMAHIKLFNPTGAGTWYVAEYDPQTRIAYGLVTGLDYPERGDFSMEELVTFRGRWGLPIERDLSWTPRPLSEVEA